MKANLKQLIGPWDEGWALDKHTISSTPIGYDSSGHMRFDTVRNEVGQALYELKYNGHDWSQVEPLAHALIEHAYAKFNDVDFIVPMPASRARNRQPVEEIAKAVGKIVRVPVHTDFLIKCSGGPSLKDLSTKDEKVQALLGRLSVSPHYNTVKAKNVLLIDDLYDSGASMEAATNVLRECAWVDRIYVVAFTWR